MVTYLFKFVPKLSDHTELLRTLTGKPEMSNGGGCPNMKSPASSSSLCKLLPQFCVTMMLTYQLQLVAIQCDASDTDLGAVLRQEGFPVMYSSRELTANTERNYAEIGKELLAIVFATEKCENYIYARDVQVPGDNLLQATTCCTKTSSAYATSVATL